MDALRPYKTLALLFLLALAVAVTGCEEWSWLFDSDGTKDTNITVVLQVQAQVSDMDGNYPEGVSVHFESGVSGSGGGGGAGDRYGDVTGPGGTVTYIHSYRIDQGNDIWITATTQVIGDGSGSNVYSGRAVITYEDAKWVEQDKRASVYRVIILKAPPKVPVIDDIGHTIRNLVSDAADSLPQSDTDREKEPEAPERPEPAGENNLKAEIPEYGVSNDRVKQGESVDAFIVLKNTGNVPIKDVRMVGMVCEQKRDGSYVPMQLKIPGLDKIDLGRIEQDFRGQNIAAGQSKRIEYSKEVPTDYLGVPVPGWLIRGHYKLVVRVTAVDANGGVVDIGEVEREFDIVSSDDSGLGF
jgi:hypothetical protein